MSVQIAPRQILKNIVDSRGAFDNDSVHSGLFSVPAPPSQSLRAAVGGVFLFPAAVAPSH
jgi:hypothetical protein